MKELIFANLKHHGRRYVATLVAVTIAVAFVAASLVFGGALNHGVREQVAGDYLGAAAVVTYDYDSEEEPDLRAAMGVVSDAPGVTEVYPAVFTGVTTRSGQGQAWLSASLIGGEILSPTELSQGNLPQAAGEVAVAEQTASRLELSLGDEFPVTTETGADTSLLITGIAKEDRQSLALVTQDLFLTRDGLDAISPDWYVQELRVALDTDRPSAADQERLVGELSTALDSAGLAGLKVQTGTDATNEALAAISSSDIALTLMLLLFPVIAASVAMIVVGTTFQVIFRQRERELALLRVIGATAKQVRRLMILESFSVGLAGSVMGVLIGVLGGAAIASGVGVVSGYGSALESASLTQVVVLVVLGTLFTTLAGYRPALRASRVSPIDALSGNVQAPARVTRRQVIGAVTSGLITLALGAETVYLAFATDADLKVDQFPKVLLFAVLTAAALITFLTFVLPLITRAAGHLGKSETYTIAAANTGRNPGRTAATGVAVFIGVTLITMVTFGAQSLRVTSMESLDRSAPVDLIVDAGREGFTPDQLTALANLDGVTASTVIEGAPGRISVGDQDVWREGEVVSASGMVQVVRGNDPTPSDGEILVPWWAFDEAQPHEVCIDESCQTLQVIPGDMPTEGDMFIMSGPTAESFGVALEPVQVWLKLSDPSHYADTIASIQDISPDFEIAGAVGVRAAIDQIVNVLVMVVVGLLGVSVLVALVGISNTLSLSVAERTRENGLLRALGMSKRQVQAMLAWEAFLIAGVSTILGILAGAYFGAVGFMSLPLGISEYTLSVPWLQWLLIALVAVGAALIASLLPGRRAAKISPVEALATE